MLQTHSVLHCVLPLPCTVQTPVHTPSLAHTLTRPCLPGAHHDDAQRVLGCPFDGSDGRLFIGHLSIGNDKQNVELHNALEGTITGTARSWGRTRVLCTAPRGLQFSSRHQPPRRGRGGSGRWVGGGVENFSPFWGHFWIPRFILSILNIHKWGEI